MSTSDLWQAHRHTHTHTCEFVMLSTEWWGHTLYVPRVSIVECCTGLRANRKAGDASGYRVSQTAGLRPIYLSGEHLRLVLTD